MRCENCGWDNPNENVKCEKCGARLGQSANQQANATQRFSDSGFDVKKTQQGCLQCGYPIRPDESQCPQCENILNGESPTLEPPSLTLDPQKKKGRTVIKGTPEGNKLVGFLVTYSHIPLGEFFPLLEGRNFVGKDDSMDVQIKDDDAVSEKHFSILYRTVDGKFKFKDEQSSNGTFINNELLDEGELTNNDIISIGSTKLIFMVIPKIEVK